MGWLEDAIFVDRQSQHVRVVAHRVLLVDRGHSQVGDIVLSDQVVHGWSLLQNSVSRRVLSAGAFELVGELPVSSADAPPGDLGLP